MRVIHIVRQFSPAVGGLENFVKSLAAEQIKLGYDVEVITLNKVFHSDGSYLPENDLVDNIKVRRVPYWGSYKYPVAMSIYKLVANSKADIVHVHAIDFIFDYLSITSFFHNKNLCVSTHGGFFHTESKSTLKKLFFNCITRFSLKSYNKVVACSSNDFDLFRSIDSTKRLSLIENGVDIDKFNNCASPFFTKSFVFIGRFSNNKRLDKLIIFFNEMIKVEPDINLFILGIDWDGNHRKLTDLISLYGLNKNIFIHENLTDNGILYYLNKCSFVVSASEYEGFGLSAIECMAAGLFPFLSDIKSFQSIVSESKVGKIFDFENTKSRRNEFFRVMKDVENNYPRYRGDCIMSSAKYSWKYKALEFESIYSEIINDSKKVILQGVSFLDLTESEAFNLLDQKVKNNQSSKIYFANAHTINIAKRDKSFQDILNMDCVFNDGIGVSIAKKLKYGSVFRANLNGTHFIPKYLENSHFNHRVYLLGASSDSVYGAYQFLKNNYSQHQYVGFHHGFFDIENEGEKVVQIIKNSKPSLLLVAMGNPMQEKWLFNNLESTSATLGFGVGALFDFMSNKVSRAPKIIRILNLEWLYRLCLEPKRMWKRYIIGNFIFMYRALRRS